MRRMQAAAVVAGLLILLVLGSALGLARYRRAAAEAKDHEHHHEVREHGPDLEGHGPATMPRDLAPGKAHSAPALRAGGEADS